MTIMSRLLARMYHLPRAETYDVVVERGLAAPMSDGTILRADRYAPRRSPIRPVILMRTPYGRAKLGPGVGALFAERGFQVVVQSCRGTDDSGGRLSPFRGEREDGLDTLAWLRQQPWCDGRIGMAGASYHGFTQWALAADAGSEIGALSTQATSAEFRTVMYPGGNLNLALFLNWIQITEVFGGSMWKTLRSVATSGRRLKQATRHLPLLEADRILLGREVDFWRDWLQHNQPDDSWWASEDYSGRVADVLAPNHLISGWYDFALPQLLRDYEALRAAGRNPFLTIGPWSHSSSGMFTVSLQESLLWLRAHLLGQTDGLRTSPVRIYVMGSDSWRDLPVWPPEDMRPQRWFLHPGGGLSAVPPPTSSSSLFRYDPSDPTPSVGGAINAPMARGAGAVDNRRVEARQDLLLFTSEPLQQPHELTGPVRAEIFMAASCLAPDLFVRLCDLHPNGASRNVCDGILRVRSDDWPADADGCRRVVVELWPTAHRFKQGHRLRLQVAGGAFPRFARNLGSGEPLATGTSLRVTDFRIFHEPARPSALVVPLVGPQS